MINYNDYPFILHTSFYKDDAPETLPFEVFSEDVRKYLLSAKGFHELFDFIAIKNTLKKENANTYLHLNDYQFSKVENDNSFRNDMFSFFFKNYIHQQNGVILLAKGGQYVYMLLGVQESKKIKNVNGRYIAAALFIKDVFIGFEEAIIQDKGISIIPSGHYENDMPVGGYISFVMITLSYASKSNLKKLENLQVSEQIFEL